MMSDSVNLDIIDHDPYDYLNLLVEIFSCLGDVFERRSLRSLGAIKCISLLVF